jgi:hypothetical protein
VCIVYVACCGITTCAGVCVCVCVCGAASHRWDSRYAYANSGISFAVSCTRTGLRTKSLTSKQIAQHVPPLPPPSARATSAFADVSLRTGTAPTRSAATAWWKVSACVLVASGRF